MNWKYPLGANIKVNGDPYIIVRLELRNEYDHKNYKWSSLPAYSGVCFKGNEIILVKFNEEQIDLTPLEIAMK